MSLGPGVYDIHSPNIPTAEEVVERLRITAECVSPKRLWVNPERPEDPAMARSPPGDGRGDQAIA